MPSAALTFAMQMHRTRQFGNKIGIVFNQNALGRTTMTIYCSEDHKWISIDGEVVASNESLTETPSLLNEELESDGWVYKVKLVDAEQLGKLMNVDANRALIG